VTVAALEWREGTVDGLGHAWPDDHRLGSVTDYRGPDVSRAMDTSLAATAGAAREPPPQTPRVLKGAVFG
jgi:hypothetical protein